ncbi:hypothetical protein GCM10019017_08240 [Streptomyces showdoensis]
MGEHQLGHGGGPGVADEVRAELAAADVPERHVGAQDLPLGAVLVGDGVERDVGVGRLHVVGELDVVRLVAADHAFLLVDGEPLPGRHVVQVLLHDHVAAAPESGVLVADEDGPGRDPALGVLAAVDESQQVTLVEVAEAVHLVDDGHGTREAPRDQPGQLEAEVHALGAYVRRA